MLTNSPATDVMVSVNEVSRYYGEQCAVDNISFSLARGEILGFLGPNGAGKSTTMQIICGVLAATSGSVSIAGFDVIENPAAAKQQLGFLPEHPPLYFDLKVDEYLDYCARLRNIGRSKLASSISYAKERCGLEDHGGRLIKNLSKGYQQRVGIAQAIVHSPALVVLDEPSSGLDPIQIIEIRKLISELGEDHSVILSTHILPEVQSSCDRVLIINKGKLVLDEKVSALEGEEGSVVFTVAMQRPPLPEELSILSGVQQVELVDGQRFRLSVGANASVAEELVKLAVEKDWGLYELVPESGTLEQTFLKLTLGEISPPSEEQE